MDNSVKDMETTYDGPIPLGEVHSTHLRILSRVQAARQRVAQNNPGQDEYLDKLYQKMPPPEAVRQRHERILAMADLIRGSNKTETPQDTQKQAALDEAAIFKPDFPSSVDNAAQANEKNHEGAEPASAPYAENVDILEIPIEPETMPLVFKEKKQKPTEEAKNTEKLPTEKLPIVEKTKPVKKPRSVRQKKETKKTQKRNSYPVKVKFPIALKLVAIVASLLLLSLGAITIMVSKLVSADVRLTAEDNNFSINRRTANAIDASLANTQSAVRALLFDLSSLENRALLNNTPTEKNRIMDFFFKKNTWIAAVALSPSEIILNTQFFNENNLGITLPEVWLEGAAEDLVAAGNGTILRNASTIFGIPILAMLLPSNGVISIVFFSPDMLQYLLGNGNNISFLLDESGYVLVHPDKSLAAGGVNFNNLPYIRNILENNNQDIQKIYEDEQGNKYFGTFTRIKVGNGTVFTMIRQSIVYSGITQTTLRNIIISFIALGLSVLFIFIFSTKISRPLHALTKAVEKLEAGDYELGLSHKSRDEIGVLTESFTGMGMGIKNFERFANRALVRLAKQGKLSRTGENKNITVCFSIIRDFHILLEGLQASSVVDFVNKYLKLMVPCIVENGGSVDKFLTQDGVVIMALWGTPETSGNAETDALNCLKAALSMRACLLCLNAERRLKYGIHIPIVKMGCGINSGGVIAGQIGSEDRMEYTVIGDAVNLAARIEGPNDLFDTDILISEETYNLAGKYLTIEEQQSIFVKGKEKPLRIFSVVNLRESADAETLLQNLNKMKGTDPLLCSLCIGPNGPAAMDEVRTRWGLGTKLDPQLFREGLESVE